MTRDPLPRQLDLLDVALGDVGVIEAQHINVAILARKIRRGTRRVERNQGAHRPRVCNVFPDDVSDARRRVLCARFPSIRDYR